MSEDYERVQRQMDFIVQQQANFSTQMNVAKEEIADIRQIVAGLAISQARTEAILAETAQQTERNSRLLAHISEVMLAMVEKQDRLTETQQQLTEQQQQLTESQQHTDERLNALIDIVTDWRDDDKRSKPS